MTKRGGHDARPAPFSVRSQGKEGSAFPRFRAPACLRQRVNVAGIATQP
jgi:hypothetical protein